MHNLNTQLSNYLEYCNEQKRLDKKTLKAYKIDLNQFITHIELTTISELTPPRIEQYIAYMHKTFKPKTVVEINTNTQ